MLRRSRLRDVPAHAPIDEKWIFPSVVYDYAAAGVGGMRAHRLIEIDKAEIAAQLAYLRGKTRHPFPGGES